MAKKDGLTSPYVDDLVGVFILPEVACSHVAEVEVEVDGKLSGVVYRSGVSSVK